MKLRLGGVPEHFNYLWHWNSTKELSRQFGFSILWTDFAGGTGSMIEALENKDIDVAIMLTEGAIAAIDSGKNYKIWFPFVMSPLIWGVFSSANRQIPLPNGYQNSKFAISRKFSGSHLMSQFLASKFGTQLSDKNFVITQNLQGAEQSLSSGEADYFLWEKYMTWNLVENRIFNYNGQVTAPWPAFVFVARNEPNSLKPNAFKSLTLEIIKSFDQLDKEIAINDISKHYNLRKEDTIDWLNQVKYYDGNEYWKDRIAAAQLIMQANGMCKNIHSLDTFLFS